MLEEGKEHGGLGVFGERLVFTVFHHADHFRPVAAAPEFEMLTYCIIGEPEDLARKFAIHNGHHRSLVCVVHGEGTAS